MTPSGQLIGTSGTFIFVVSKRHNGVLAESDHIIFCQLVPWEFDSHKPLNQKRTFRRSSYLVNRLAANLDATSTTPLLDRIRTGAAKTDRRGWKASISIRRKR